jgi:hypothetical protein
MTDADAFHLCVANLNQMYRSTGANELATVLADMTSGDTGQTLAHLTEPWRRCCERARAGEVDVWLRLVRPIGKDE